MIAVLISFVGIVLYIAVRFGLRFGSRPPWQPFTMCSRCWGLLCVGQRNYLAGCDRIADAGGYSLTDTVVVFDRIVRISVPVGEKMRDDHQHGHQQVLSRTIVTSLTVVIVLIHWSSAGPRCCMISRWPCSEASCWNVFVHFFRGKLVAAALAR